ncbi:secreted RxLR effector protein 161-like [Panicum virgatum]|uniref:secreted RxLR effector protein 161-like n=1 Tax=Panicum virgatum TaxID=38727 RepID=UPI0019D69CA8|nr:secreted RxLR effector protein 161-like [Panicum virgatum]
MGGCNPSHTPMEPRLKLSKISTTPPVDATEYRGIVGSLRYLVHTRPDISYSVGYVSRFIESPTAEHLAVVKRILRYIAGTIDYGCHYKKTGAELKLLGYSDADMAGDIDTRKSTTGVLFYYGSSLVSWQSQKQKVVALSSCEAEYIAATTAACQGVWLAQLLSELRSEQCRPFILKMDSKSAIALNHGVNIGEPADEQYYEQANEDQFCDPETEGQHFDQESPEGFEDGMFNPIL